MEQSTPSQVLRTTLFSAHVALGAKIVEFAGWQMPIYYEGIILEHLKVRKAVGLFDISHMGRILVRGPDAEVFLDYLSTNQIKDKPDFSATYTPWCNESGGCVDDLLVYKKNETDYFVIVNAANRQKDLAHLKKHALNYRVDIQDRYDEDGILALQGPNANALIFKFFPEAKKIPHMHFLPVQFQDQEILLSNSGYTGAGGFEIYAPNDLIVALWHSFLLEGKDLGIVPVGLGARDSLRLEMGYALYGHEITEQIAPTESVAYWTVKLHKENFLGKSALQELQASPIKRNEYGIVLIDKGIARAGYDVLKGDTMIGTVTSGIHSPTLNQAIAMILVQGSLQEGEEVAIQIRQHRCRAQVVKLPFIKGKL